MAREKLRHTVAYSCAAETLGTIDRSVPTVEQLFCGVGLSSLRKVARLPMRRAESARLFTAAAGLLVRTSDVTTSGPQGALCTAGVERNGSDRRRCTATIDGTGPLSGDAGSSEQRRC
jgi:hypothetical protein